MNLRTKFTLYISLLVLIIIIGISESIFLAQKTLLREQFQENQKKIFKDVVYTCSEALIAKDEVQVSNKIKSIIRTYMPAIVYAGYISPTGTLLFSARDPDQEKNLAKRITQTVQSGTDEVVSGTGEEILEYYQPFYINNEYMGTVRAGFSHSYLELQIKEGMTLTERNIILVAIFVLIVGVFLANLLHNKVEREFTGLL